MNKSNAEQPIFRPYECSKCKEIENIKSFDNEINCECGGIYHVVKDDYFQEVEYIENCMICRNQNSFLCKECSEI